VNTVFGLPLHPLVVHLTVVAVPLAALLVVLVAVVPRLPWLMRWSALVVSALSLALIPLTESTGEALEHQVRETALVKQHSEMGEGLLPWVIGLFVVCLGLLVVLRRIPLRRSDAPGTPRLSAMSGQRLLIVRIMLGLIAVALAAGTIVQTVRIGHSGAQATWSTPGSVAPASPGAEHER
jgi:glucan phosphoethanolaminetransferase (alkaline phosphatase superfamily)